MSSDTKYQNIFGINNPRDWWCRVNSLTSAHSTMRIDVIRLQTEDIPPFSEFMYLEFRKVAYYSGWLTWVNANFRRAEVAEKAQFIRGISSTHRDLPNDELIVNSSEFGTLTLFVAEGSEGKQNQILANAARILDKDNNVLLEVG